MMTYALHICPYCAAAHRESTAACDACQEIRDMVCWLAPETAAWLSAALEERRKELAEEVAAREAQLEQWVNNTPVSTHVPVLLRGVDKSNNPPETLTFNAFDATRQTNNSSTVSEQPPPTPLLPLT